MLPYGWLAAETTETTESFGTNMRNYVTDSSNWIELGITILQIMLIVTVGRFVIRTTKKAVEHIIEKRMDRPGSDVRRTRTIGRLVSNVISYVLNFIIVLLILEKLGIPILPLLAGASVLGLAIGFGAQNLVRDVITGFFIIFEDQFGVGDIIQTGNFKGTVEEIGLRITKIKNWTGEIHIIPNGSITEVTNFSINNSVAVCDVSVAYEADIDRAISIIRDTALKVYEGNENMVKEPEVLGVQTLGASDVVLRVVSECKPNTHFAVARELNAELKKALDREGIEIPYPRLVTYHRNEAEQTG